jgi:Fic-DOC domain mobile mystery protein B
MKFHYPPGATPIDPDEAEGLIPKHITLQRELNEWEEANIQEAVRWARGRQRKDVVSVDFIQRLHREMFGETWTWAGEFRRTNKNIGVDKHQIHVELRNLCDDVKYWIENKTYPDVEIAVRFHHRLVSIHPFPNGNGRHARLMADLLMARFGKPTLSWGRTNLTAPAEARTKYIAALRAADRLDMKPLIAFAQS